VSGPEKRIEEVLMEHGRRIDPNHPGYGNCRCGFIVDLPQDQAAHVAAAVLASLNLTEQWGVVTEDVFGDETPDDYADDQAHAEELAAERCQSCDHCRNALPKHIVRRLVGPWSVAPQEQP
jgi:hypothetical protein